MPKELSASALPVVIAQGLSTCRKKRAQPNACAWFDEISGPAPKYTSASGW